MENSPYQDDDECLTLESKPSHTKLAKINATIIIKFDMAIQN